MERSVFSKGLFSLLLIFSTFFAQAKTPTSENFLIKIDETNIPNIFRTIPEDPSMFAIAGINYLHQSSFCEINLEAYNSGRLQFQLTNLNGEVLFSDQKPIHEGINNIGLSIRDYPIGIYHLAMSLDNKEKVLVIEKVSNNQIKASLISTVY